jgi:chromosome segregation ATPase
VKNEYKVIMGLVVVIVVLGLILAFSSGRSSSYETNYTDIRETIEILREYNSRLRENVNTAENISQKLRKNVNAYEQTIAERERAIAEREAIIRERDEIIAEYTADAERRQKLAEIANQLNRRIGDTIEAGFQIIRQGEREREQIARAD